MSSSSTGKQSVCRISRICSHLLCSSDKTIVPSSFSCNAAMNQSGMKTEEKDLEMTGDRAFSKPNKANDDNDCFFLPNETWTKESLDLFNKLQSEADESNGLWVKNTRLPPTQPGNRTFSLHLWDQKGKLFEYILFLNKREQRLRGVLQFGPYTEGPKGYVHGGAIATVLDVAHGVCIYSCGFLSVTANLSVDFKVAVPIGSTVLMESRVDQVEGRKVFGFAEMKSPDGFITYATSKALFIQVSPDNKDKEKQNPSQAVNQSGMKVKTKIMGSDKAWSKSFIAHYDQEDQYLPNKTWTKESLELFNKLQHEADNSNGLWVKKTRPPPSQPGNRTFPLCLWDQKGKLFEYSLFLNKREQRLRGVFQFGPYTEGPKGYVHGGAIATVLDVGHGECVNFTELLSVTANLSVDFKIAVPIGSTILLESRVDQVEGRKVFGYAEMKSPDGSIIYATSKALFIQVSPDYKDKEKQNSN